MTDHLEKVPNKKELMEYVKNKMSIEEKVDQILQAKMLSYTIGFTNDLIALAIVLGLTPKKLADGIKNKKAIKDFHEELIKEINK